MSDQFLNLEGRDTFNADNGYEKVKIVNGGIPQNSDLNEQSSIDEERARNIMKEGFGSGKRHKDDFTIHLDTGELLLKVRESEAGVIGTLWQDGNRLKLLSASDITIADNDTTPVYRKLKSTGYFRGRVYLVHAKQDYIDPNAKLTVRDINSTNLIQVDTAVREKRVVDYYIDWSVDGVTELPLSSDPARIDCSINGNGSVDPVVLDDTHAFSGKTTFVDSPLYGFTGYLYYLGDIVQVDGGQQTVDPEKSELFNGNSDNVLYTGGDTAHRRDTEIAGLVSTTGIDPIELEGLKLKVGGTETDPIDVELAGDPNVTFHVSLAKLSITATEADEQLHMPSLSNAYHILEDDLTSVELFNQVLEKNSLTLATFFQTAFAGHAQDMAEELLSEYLILYVDGDSLSSLDDVTSYKIWYDSFDSFFSTKDRFVIALFKIVVQGYVSETKAVTLSFFTETPDVNYIHDKRTYRINDTDKIKFPSKNTVANLKRYAIKVMPLSGSFLADYYIYFGPDATAPLFIGTVIGYDAGTDTLIFESEDVVSLTAAMLITQSDGATATYLSTSVNPDCNMNVVDVDVKDSDLPTISKTEDDFSITSEPKTFTHLLAQVKGAFASLLPSDNSSIATRLSRWKDLFKRGISIFYIQMVTRFVPAQLIWTLPFMKMKNTAYNLISILWGYTGTTYRQGKSTFINFTRTLRDSDGNINPIVYILGSSNIGALPFAPMIHLKHYGNSTATPPGKLGGMIVLQGNTGLIACPYSLTDFRDLDPYTEEADLGVIVDGETGSIRASNIKAFKGWFRDNLVVAGSGTFMAGVNVTGALIIVGTANVSGLATVGNLQCNGVIYSPTIGKIDSETLSSKKTCFTSIENTSIQNPDDPVYEFKVQGIIASMAGQEEVKIIDKDSLLQLLSIDNTIFSVDFKAARSYPYISHVANGLFFVRSGYHTIIRPQHLPIGTTPFADLGWDIDEDSDDMDSADLLLLVIEKNTGDVYLRNGSAATTYTEVSFDLTIRCMPTAIATGS